MKFEQAPAPSQEQAREEQERETPERGFKKYLRGFQLSEVELRGKKIADIGCGNEALFVRYAQDHGIDAIGIDPAVEPALEREGRIVKGNLASVRLDHPDLVLSYGVIGTLQKLDVASSIETLLEELNEGGEIRIYPYDASDTLKGIQESKARMDKAFEELGDRIDVTITKVNEVETRSGQTYTQSVVVIRKKEDVMNKTES